MAMLLILFVVAAASAMPERLSVSGKIVGGEETDITQVPYQVSLEQLNITSWNYLCGASIVSQNFVLTAASCVTGAKNDTIRFRSGSSSLGDSGNGDIHTVTDISIHPQLDAALVRVKEPFIWSNTTQAIDLPAAEPMEGDIATVSGWGMTSEGGSILPEKLQSVQVPIVSREKCREVYGDEVTEWMICAGVPEGGVGPCEGDLGGPLVVNNALAGIVSWGEGCARPDKPGVYTNVAKLFGWLQSYLK